MFVNQLRQSRFSWLAAVHPKISKSNVTSMPIKFLQKFQAYFVI